MSLKHIRQHLEALVKSVKDPKKKRFLRKEINNIGGKLGGSNMNKELEKYAREKLKEGLAQCDDRQREVFKKMYSPHERDLDIDTVVDNMEVGELDWALTQVQNTLEKS